MRYKFFMIELFILMAASGCAAASAAVDSNLPGDADGNSIVDVWDVRSVARCLASEGRMQVPCPRNADVNRNGKVDRGDMEAIANKVNGTSTISLKAGPDEDAALPVGDTICIRAGDSFLPYDVVRGTVHISSAAAGFDSGEQQLTCDKDGRSFYYHWVTAGLKPALDYKASVDLWKKPDHRSNAAASSEIKAAPISEDTSEPVEKPTTANERQFSQALQLALTPRDHEDSMISSATDIRLPYWDIGLHMTRRFIYDSKHPVVCGPLGYGWTHAYHVQLHETTDGCVHLAGIGPLAACYRRVSEGVYQSPLGDFSRLHRDSDGSFHLLLPNGDQWSFNAELIPTYFQNAQTRRIEFIYEGKKLRRAIDQSGQWLGFEYDKRGLLSRVEDSTGRSASYSFDAEGQLRSVDADGQQIKYKYDKEHRLVRIDLPDGRREQFAYDAEGRLHAAVGGGRAAVHLEYSGSPAGSRGRTIDSAGYVRREHNSRDGLIMGVEDHANGSTLSFAYDEMRRLVRAVSPAGNAWTIERDEMNRPTTLTDCHGHRLVMRYGSSTSGPTSIVDANGFETRYQYLDTGEPTHIHYPDGTAEIRYYSRSPHGLNVKRVLRNGQTIQYVFDERGLLQEKRRPDRTVSRYRYNDQGHLISAVNHWGTLTFEYDKYGRLTKATYPGDRSFQYGYKNGTLTSITDPDGRLVTYAYDAAGQLTQIANEGGKALIAYQLNNNAQITECRFGNGVRTIFSYDKQGELSQLEHRGQDGTAIGSWACEHDALGRITAISSDGRKSYRYDTDGRLAGVQYADGSAENYDYDHVGNRRLQVIRGMPIKITTDVMNATTSIGDELRNFDLNGNLNQRKTPDGKTTYEYDSENQLVRATLPNGATIAYDYDALGRLAARYVGNEETRFLWDGAHIALEEDGKHATRVAYLWSGIAEQPFGLRTGDRDWFVLHDACGSATALTDSEGSVVATYRYSAFGCPTLQGAHDNPFLFQSAMFDRELGLYLMDGRWYEPGSGLFLQPLPPGPGALDHPYTLADNNPLRQHGSTRAESFAHGWAEVTEPMRSRFPTSQAAETVAPAATRLDILEAASVPSRVREFELEAETAGVQPLLTGRAPR